MRVSSLFLLGIVLQCLLSASPAHADNPFGETAIYFANSEKPLFTDIETNSSWAGKCARAVKPDRWFGGMLSFFSDSGETSRSGPFAVVSYWQAPGNYTYSFDEDDIKESRAASIKRELPRTEALASGSDSLTTNYQTLSERNFVFLRKNKNKSGIVWVYRSNCYLSAGCTEVQDGIKKTIPRGEVTAYCFFDRKIFQDKL